MLSKFIKIFLFATLVLTPSTIAYGQADSTIGNLADEFCSHPAPGLASACQSLTNAANNPAPGSSTDEQALAILTQEISVLRQARNLPEYQSQVAQITEEVSTLETDWLPNAQESVSITTGPLTGTNVDAICSEVSARGESVSRIAQQCSQWNDTNAQYQPNERAAIARQIIDSAIAAEQSQANPDQARIDELKKYATGAATAAQSIANTTAPTGSSAGCHLSIPLLGDCLFERALAGIGNGLVFIFKWVLWAANGLFNLVLKISVVEFSTLAAIPGIKAAWVILRDAFNIIFIAALIYVAIGTILQISGVDWKKMVTNIIIAALLINFSMVFAKVIIDASNLLSLTFYYGSVDQSEPPSAGGAPDITSQIIRGIKIDAGRDRLEITNPMNAAQEADSKAVPTWDVIILRTFGNIVIILMLAFVLLVAAALFIVRTVVLIFLLVLSPVAFLGRVLPFFSKYSSQWWGELIKQCTFAPVYMFLFYVVIKLIGSDQGGGATIQTALAGIGAPGTFIYFLIVFGLLSFTIIVAQQSGAVGAKQALGFANKYAKPVTTGLGMALGGAALRNTLGRAAKSIGESKVLRRDVLATGSIPVIGGIATATQRAMGRSIQTGLGAISTGTGYQAKLDREAKDAKQFKTDDERLRYIAGLNSDSRKNVYEAMTADQRLALETEAKKAGQEKMVQTLRNNLSAEEQAKMIGRRTTGLEQKTDFEEVMRTASKEKQQEIFEALAADDRVAIITETGGFDADGKPKDAAVKAIYEALSDKEKAKVTDERNKMKDRSKKADEKAKVDKAKEDLKNADAVRTAEIMRGLNDDQIADIGSDLVAMGDKVINNLNSKVLTKIENKLTEDQRATVYQTIINNPGAAHPDALSYVTSSPKAGNYRNARGGQRQQTPPQQPAIPAGSDINPASVALNPNTNQYEATNSRGTRFKHDGSNWVPA